MRRYRRCALLGGHDVQLEHRDDILAQTHRRLVGTDRLDRRAELDGLRVDRDEAGGLDGGRDVGGLHRDEQGSLATRLDGKLERGLYELGLEGLGLFERGERAGGAGRIDLLYLLLTARAPRHGEARR